MKLASAIDTQGQEFRANASAMRALVQQLEERRGEAALGGPQRSRDGMRRAESCFLGRASCG